MRWYNDLLKEALSFCFFQYLENPKEIFANLRREKIIKTEDLLQSTFCRGL